MVQKITKNISTFNGTKGTFNVDNPAIWEKTNYKTHERLFSSVIRKCCVLRHLHWKLLKNSRKPLWPVRNHNPQNVWHQS